MLRLTFAGMSGLTTRRLMAYGSSSPAATGVAVCDRMLRYFLLFISCLLVLTACGDGLTGRAEGTVAKSPPEVTQLSAQEKLAALEESIDEAVKEFGLDVATNAVRMFRHTIWVLADEDTIKEKLAENRYELVGEVIRGTDQEGGGVDIWGVESPPMSGGQVYVASTGDNLVVAFRSTDSDDGWEVTLNVLTDLKAYPTKISFVDDTVPKANKYRKINVHAGFHNEYLRYRERILGYVAQHPDKDIYVTGHSLGGALAVLNGFDIAVHTQRPVTVFTFGQPRVGGDKFREAYEELVPDSYRVVVDGDPIPRVPGMLIDYEHVGKLLQFDGKGAQLAPDDIQSSALFQLFDFPKHVLKSYYASLRELQSSCDSSNSLANYSCLNVGWLVTAADAERESSRKAWQVVPKDSIPWENIPLDQVTIEKIPVDKLPTEFPDLKMPPWTKMAPVRKIFVDNVPIDEIPLDSLVDKLELEDIPLDELLGDFSVDKLPVGKLPLDKLPLDKVPVDKLPLDKFRK